MALWSALGYFAFQLFGFLTAHEHRFIRPVTDAEQGEYLSIALEQCAQVAHRRREPPYAALAGGSEVVLHGSGFAAPNRVFIGGREVTPEQAPGLHAMIERLCIQADLPKPKIAVADTPMPNALAILLIMVVQLWRIA